MYKDWDDFLNNNQLPKCTCCYPRGGIYDGDEHDRVYLEFGTTPAAKARSVVCSALDTASTVVMVSSAGNVYVRACGCVCVRVFCTHYSHCSCGEFCR